MLLSFVPAARAKDRSPCPSIIFTGSSKVRLTAAERRLVCGDPQTEGWKSIPLNEAKYFLRSFLQQRGYQNPRFDAENGRLLIDAGAKTLITRFSVRGMPPGRDPSKLRKIVGQLLTPKQLDLVNTALRNLLQNGGYACPQITLSADAKTGVVAADVVPGPRETFGPIEPAKLEGLDARVFRRYEAFHAGAPLDMRLLNLTAERTLTDALFMSAYYDVDCSTAGMKISQKVVEGKPREFKIGVGADTEGILMGTIQWTHSRIGWRASEAEVTLVTSNLQQSAETSMHNYLAEDSRVYLMPRALIERLNELRYSAVISQESVSPGASWDLDNARLQINAGPAFNYVSMLTGLGPSNDAYFSFDTRTDLVGDLYEYYAKDPREGWTSALTTSSRYQGAYSDVSAHQLKLSGEKLWNLGQYDPPLLVLGTRGYAATTYVSDRANFYQALSPEARYFPGGDADLRGATLEGIPSDDEGFLTAVYDGLELRMGNVLPYGLQPFVFIDGVMAGRLYFHVDPDVYWSPGLGLRWATPVGSIRTTIARGELWHRDTAEGPLYSPHWQFFFSFGKEF
jgi:translocation and assembly module TamA